MTPMGVYIIDKVSWNEKEREGEKHEIEGLGCGGSSGDIVWLKFHLGELRRNLSQIEGSPYLYSAAVY